LLALLCLLGEWVRTNCKIYRCVKTLKWVARMNQTWPVREFRFQQQYADPVSEALAAYVPPKRLDPPTKLYGVKTHTSLNTDPLKTKINLTYI